MTLNNLNQSINKTNAHTCVAVKMAALLTVGPTPMYRPRTPWVWTISLNAEAVLLYRGTSPSKTLPWACILTLTKSVGVAIALPIVPLTNHNHIRFKLCLKKVKEALEILWNKWQIVWLIYKTFYSSRSSSVIAGYKIYVNIEYLWRICDLSI